VTFLKNYLKRSSRLRFWFMFFIFLSLIGLAQDPNPFFFQTYWRGLFQAGLVLIIFQTFFSRARDAGISEAWAWAMCLPGLNFIAIYYLGFKPSKTN